MKRILAVSYSQSGQLDNILDHFLAPFEPKSVERVRIKPISAYPFPWSSQSFFNQMPETVLERPIALQPLSFRRPCYDLIVVGYQPWFLSPSQPTTSLFAQAEFRALLADTPVVTIIGARNMWIKSQERLVQWIQDAGGFLVANVPFIDKTQNHLSAFTILHWMMTGEKTRKWGLLPIPGVAREDIESADQFGRLVADALEQEHFAGLQQSILALGSIHIAPSLLFVEMRAKLLFGLWARFITRYGGTPRIRRILVAVFQWYLLIALFIVSPPILLLHAVFVRPFTRRSFVKQAQHYLYLGMGSVRS